MANINSEASAMPMAEALAPRESLLNRFVEVARGESGPRTAPDRPSRAEPRHPALGGLLSVSIAPSMRDIEAAWRDLAARARVSPYQRYDLAAAWVRNAAPAEGVEARIGVVRDGAGDIVMILPFGIARQFGIHVAVYLGGEHFNLNMPLADPDLKLTPQMAAALLEIYALEAGADLVLLRHQPERWRGREHPFLCLPHYGAPDDVRLVVIDGDFDSYLLRQLSRKMRSELRRKTVKFKDAGVNGATRAESADQVERFLDTFIRQKSKRLAAQGVDDPFALPGVREFLRDAALAGLTGDGGLEMHAIVRDGQVLSVRAGVRHGDHLSFMVQSFDGDEALAKYTPSEFLLTEVLLGARTRGVTNFDFGIGDGRFKQIWSNDFVPVFNITHGVTRKGAMFASLVRAKDAAKRYIKRHERLFSAVQDARALGAKVKGSAGLSLFAS